jgi:hypothetical protein
VNSGAATAQSLIGRLDRVDEGGDTSSVSRRHEATARNRRMRETAYSPLADIWPLAKDA